MGKSERVAGAGHYMQGPRRVGAPIRYSRWSVGCRCGWKVISRGNQRDAKAAWQKHMGSVSGALDSGVVSR